MLELKSIFKSYKSNSYKQVVLKDINIKFRDSEFVSILGSSGSGKTTLLNIIGGLDSFDSGDILIDGISTREFKAKDWDSYRNKKIGFIFQNYNLINHQTIYKNIEIALSLSGIRNKKKIVKDSLVKVGMIDHINKKPNQLSGGQMQRVAVARALINKPSIILADEPTGALDSNNSIEVMNLLKDISNDKLVIMVTHNKELAKKYSTRIIEIKDGVIVSDSKPCSVDVKKVVKLNIRKKKMNLLSSISLSLSNLFTKKSRTILTSIAGSIGIVGISIILSLSNGVNKYTKELEEESLSDYPIVIDKVYNNSLSVLGDVFNDDKNISKCDDTDLCSYDDFIESSVTKNQRYNNLKDLKIYIENNNQFKDNAQYIDYKYDFTFQVYTKDYKKVNPSSINGLSQKDNFKELNYNSSKYNILYGRMPESYNELVLVINNNTIPDSILYALDIKNRKDVSSLKKKFRKNKKYKINSCNYNYEDIVGFSYKLILNTDYYKKYKNKYLNYSGNKRYMKKVIKKSLDIEIVGIVNENNNDEAYIGYNKELVNYVIDNVSKTNIYQKHINNKNINVLNNKKYSDLDITYEDVSRELAMYEYSDPSSIYIYPKNYKSKERIIEALEDYKKVSYTDLMKTLINGITKIIDIVSYILIGFIAISLIVSSIMISIITYISVLERTKEIGILRAIGASKKDIKRVFISEVILEGFMSGVIGVLVSMILCNIINILVYKYTKINNIADINLVYSLGLILLSILLNVIAGNKPSRKASKLNPILSLRCD